MLLWGGVMAANAFAEGPVWFVNGVELKATETVEADGSGSLSFFTKGEVHKIRVECKKSTEKLKLIGGQPGKDEDVLSYKECLLVEPTGCKVKEPITLEANTTLVFLVKKTGKWVSATKAEWEAATEKAFGDKFVGKGAGNTLAKLTVEGCASEGIYSLTGTYTGLVNSGLEFTEEIASEVKFGAEVAVPVGKLSYEGDAKQVLEVRA